MSGVALTMASQTVVVYPPMGSMKDLDTAGKDGTSSCPSITGRNKAINYISSASQRSHYEE